MRRASALVLAVLLGVPVFLPQEAEATHLPDCDADDNGATQHAIPFTSPGSGGCRDTLIAQIDDVSQLWYGGWRRWDQTIRVDVLDPAVIRVTRTILGQEWERVEGPGPIVLTRDVPWPVIVADDLGVRDIIRIDLLVGAVVDVEITVTQTPHTDGDCGGADSSAYARTTLTSGVACYGRFVDGWRFGQARADYPYPPTDGYTVPSLTDGDIVNFRVTSKGHSYDVTAIDRDDAAGTARTTVTRMVGSDQKDIRLVKVGLGRVDLTVQPVYPDVQSHVECGWGCYTIIDAYLDTRSNGPFDYNVTATVTPNDRPSFTVLDMPSFVFDGDRIPFQVRVTDPDGQTVRVDARSGWQGQTVSSLLSAPASGPSGTTFSFSDGPALGTGAREIRLNAYDSLNAPALLADNVRTVRVHPADCGAGRGDSPAEGRAFTTSCTGWVGSDDASDLLLRDVPTGPQRVSFVATGLGMSVTSPAGETRNVPAGELYLDYAPNGGLYELRLAATGPSQAYTISSTAAPVPAATGRHLVTAQADWTSAPGDQLADAVVALDSDDRASRSFEVPAEVLQRATSARLKVLAQGPAGCSGLVTRFFVNDIYTSDPGCLWSSTAPSWATIPIPLAWLAAGPNKLELRPRTDLSLAVDRTYLSDASTISADASDPGGELVWALEVSTSWLDAAAAPQRGLPAVYRFVVDDTGGQDAVVTLDWGDGSPVETFPAKWGVPVSRLHTYATTGLAPLVATAVAASRQYAAQHAIDVHFPADCGGVGDAPPDGRLVTTGCAGFLAHDDPEDLLLVDLPAGRHAVLTLTGANGELLPPGGGGIAFLEGAAHEWTAAGGRWAVRLTPIGSPTGDVPYTLSIASSAAPSPTGAIVGTVPLEWASGLAMPVALNATDLHYDDVMLTLSWGDGATDRLPASGYAPSGAFAASHSWAAPGTYAWTATAANRYGAALTPLSGTVRIVTADDCGFGDAPNTNDPGTVPFLSDARCWGRLDAADTDDYYAVPTTIGETFRVVVCSYGPLQMTPLLFYRLPLGTGVGSAAFVSSTTAGACTTLTTGVLAPALGDQYLLRLQRTGGAGAYTVEILRD